MGKTTKDRFVKTLGGEVSPELFGVRAGKVQAALNNVIDARQAFEQKYSFKPGKFSSKTLKGFQDRLDDLENQDDSEQKYTALKALKIETRAFEKLHDEYCKKFGKFIEKWDQQRQRPPGSALPAVTNAHLKVLFHTAGEHGFDISKVSPAEAFGVFFYTENYYTDLNKHLLGIANPPLTGQPQAEIEAVGTLTAAALKKLPNYPAVTQRGETDWPGAAAQYTVGNTFAIRAFWSTGENFAFTEKWALTLSGKTGKKVQGLSANPHENEVLFPPGTRFRVLAVNDANGDGSDMQVTLKEV